MYFFKEIVQIRSSFPAIGISEHVQVTNKGNASNNGLLDKKCRHLRRLIARKPGVMVPAFVLVMFKLYATH